MDNEIKKALWATADKLRSNMDAAEYKHLVLGLIFLKYISDSFAEHRANLEKRFADSKDDYFIEDARIRATDLEERDYYTEANVFWVPADARWEQIRAKAKQPTLGKIIDDALVEIETENPRLKNLLDKRFARTELQSGKLGELVDEISKIGLTGKGHNAKDVLGEVYEYFLGQFANAEGKKGGQFYTPASVVKVLVEVLAPHEGKVYDPCCGSGGMFVQSEKFMENHGGRFGDISIYGQESNPTTWRLVAMNLAIRGMDFNLGKEPADTFLRDQHPDLRANYIMANPPFNVSDWWNAQLEGDPRWQFGTPPGGNANYAWLQHIYYHLAPNGRAGVVLANGSMSSSQNSEGTIRREMIERDAVECMVALPAQLFFNTQIPACLWFLNKNKGNRNGEILFIDARKLGRLENRVNRVFGTVDIFQIAQTYHNWIGDSEANGGYEDSLGFCRSASLDEVRSHDYILTPGRYVGAELLEDDDEAFAEKMERLTSQLVLQFEESSILESEIRGNLKSLGIGL
ncbi:MAG: class I SAM-dependent DNA methyltransferase [Pyrinomonadaceae bacterium]|nr:type I restriction-modification system subunit M [Chloracidobacterium sp.]HRI04942.1 class I SAM-dependent DNA methyltransferase [Pyrinomonadaceae bacterium]